MAVVLGCGSPGVDVDLSMFAQEATNKKRDVCMMDKTTGIERRPLRNNVCKG